MIEAFRYLCIGGGLVMVGFNAAVIRHAAKIVDAVKAWRLFMTGDSLLTLFVVVSIYDRIHGPITWRLPLAAAAISLTLTALVMLDHAYRKRNRR